jgi:hypothetical protein
MVGTQIECAEKEKQKERGKETTEGESETIEDSKIVDVRNYKPKRYHN